MAGQHDRVPAGTVPFWAHQLAEMLLGGLLLIEGARAGQHTAVLVGMGSALILLSLLSDGALGAWPRIGRRLHRVLDFVAAAALAVSPLVLSLDAVLAIVILEATALGMVWLAVRTNWTPRRRNAAPAPAVKPAATPAPAPTPEPAAPPAAPLARKLGSAVGKARDDGPRRLGRIVGQARNRLRDAPASDTPASDTPASRSPGPAPDPDGRPDPPVDG